MPSTRVTLPVLSTPRLVLRPVQLEDAAALAAIYGDPETARYLAMDLLRTPAQMRAKLVRDVAAVAAGEAARWVLTLPGSAEAVGYVALFAHAPREARAEVGFVLARSLWGQGHLTEVLPVLLGEGFGRMALHRIEARVDPRNAASLAVLARHGFRREGLLRENAVDPDGRRTDTVLLALLAPEWRARTQPSGDTPP